MFTYNDADLTTDLNKVRRLVGDVNSTSPEFQDEEMNFFIDEEANIYSAAALACTNLAVRYAQHIDKSLDGFSLSASQKYEHYKELAAEYTAKAKVKGTPQVYSGGISVSDKTTIEADTDIPTPDFYRGQFDYPGSVASSSRN